MHVEVQVALNFLISFLYNKLPRRRVNQFGEELELTLKSKFEGHWYPDRPCKGSAYRCIRCAPPLDPLIFEVAARHSGMDLVDLQENLPHELSIWVDPGEVSYRISEKGQVKILYSERAEEKETVVSEPVSALNPEAQCFKPIDPLVSAPSTIPLGTQVTPNYGPPVSSFLASKNSNPVTFTTATFAATKFGSTKLKTNGKKGQRSSPTDFNHFLKHKPISPNKRSCISSFTPIDHTGFPPTNLLGDLENWKSNNSCTYKNIWAALPQISPRKVVREGLNLLDDEQQVGGEAHELALHGVHSQTSHCGSSPKRMPSQSFGACVVEGSGLALLSDRLWEDIFHLSPESSPDLGPLEACGEAVGVEGSERNEPLYCSSFSLSSTSSPSLSSSNGSCSLNLNLLSEFDNLSLNSSSSSTGSVSSYIT